MSEEMKTSEPVGYADVETAWISYTEGKKPSVWGREVFEAGFRAALSRLDAGEVCVPANEQQTQVEGYLHRLKGGGDWNISLPSQMDGAWAYQKLWPEKIEIVPLVAQSALSSEGK